MMTAEGCEITGCDTPDDLYEYDTPMHSVEANGYYFMTLCKKHRDSFVNWVVKDIVTKAVSRSTSIIVCE